MIIIKLKKLNNELFMNNPKIIIMQPTIEPVSIFKMPAKNELCILAMDTRLSELIGWILFSMKEDGKNNNSFVTTISDLRKWTDIELLVVSKYMSTPQMGYKAHYDETDRILTIDWTPSEEYSLETIYKSLLE